MFLAYRTLGSYDHYFTFMVDERLGLLFLFAYKYSHFIRYFS